jgi:hypothetical protein
LVYNVCAMYRFCKSPCWYGFFYHSNNNGCENPPQINCQEDRISFLYSWFCWQSLKKSFFLEGSWFSVIPELVDKNIFTIWKLQSYKIQ